MLFSEEVDNHICPLLILKQNRKTYVNPSGNQWPEVYDTK